MSTTAATKAALETTIRLLDRLFDRYRPLDFQVRLWDGSTWGAAGAARCTLALKHPGALRQMFRLPIRVAIAEAYLFDDYDIEGDLFSFFAMLNYLLMRGFGPFEKLGLWWLLRRLPKEGRPRAGRSPARLSGKLHSIERDREAVRYHYDLSNEFYALWLDSRMVYSCAYFGDEGQDLDEAQRRKLDHVCRKLRLKPGQRLLDVGCGWGGLILHAAERYGVDATGITLSPPQKELADERIVRAGLAARCRVSTRDYRELADSQPFDAIASVGMAEHVGAALLPTYFRELARALRPDGVLLNHAIGLNVGFQIPRGPTFIETYIFPDGHLVPLPETLKAAESAGFEVRDVESLREHYALTLRHWAGRLQARADEARRIAGEVSYRAWRYYLGLSEFGFRTARTTIYQTLLFKGRGASFSGLPLTRDDWYHRDPTV